MSDMPWTIGEVSGPEPGGPFDPGFGSSANVGANQPRSGDDPTARELTRTNRILEQMLRGNISQTSGTETVDSVLEQDARWNERARRWQRTGVGGTGFVSEEDATLIRGNRALATQIRDRWTRRAEEDVWDVQSPVTESSPLRRWTRREIEHPTPVPEFTRLEEPLDETSDFRRQMQEERARQRQREQEEDSFEDARRFNTYTTVEAAEYRALEREARGTGWRPPGEGGRGRGGGGGRDGRGGGEGGEEDPNRPGMFGQFVGAGGTMLPHGGGRAFSALLRPLVAALGPVGGPMAAIGIGATAAVAGYEFAPSIRSFFARREQFRDEYVDSQKLAARAEYQRGGSVPFGTIGFNAEGYIPGLTKAGVDEIENNRLNRELDATARDRSGDPRLGRFNRRTMQAMDNIREMQRLGQNTRMAEANLERLQAQAAQLAPAEKDASNFFREDPYNPNDPEWSRLDKQSMTPNKFDPRDMRLGGLMAPILSTLRRAGYDTDSAPHPHHQEKMSRDDFIKDWLKPKGPVTDAEWGKEDHTPHYYLVQSVYSGMSA